MDHKDISNLGGSKVQALTSQEVDAVAGGKFVLASGRQSWGDNIRNLGLINGTINRFNLPIEMVQWN